MVSKEREGEGGEGGTIEWNPDSGIRTMETRFFNLDFELRTTSKRKGSGVLDPLERRLCDMAPSGNSGKVPMLKPMPKPMPKRKQGQQSLVHKLDTVRH